MNLLRQHDYKETIYIHGSLEKLCNYYKKEKINIGDFDKVSKKDKNFYEGKITLPIILLFQKADDKEKKRLKEIFSKSIRNGNDLEYSLSLIKKYEIIKACYQKAEHYINLASNSLSVFGDSEEKSILENLTSFSLTRNF